MKRILILLLLTPFLFTQESASEPPTPTYEIEIDYRCKSAVVWSVTLIGHKQSGRTYEEEKHNLETDYLYGALSTATPEGMAYLFDILDLVYSHEQSRDTNQIVDTAIQVNDMCIDYMNTPAPEVKPTIVKT